MGPPTRALAVGETFTLTANSNVPGFDKLLDWTMPAGTNVVNINRNTGKMEAKCTGTVKVTLTLYYDGKAFKDDVWVTVSTVSSYITPDILTLNEGESRLLSLTVFGMTGYSVSWNTYDNDIISVSNGVVYAKKAGTATVYAYASNSNLLLGAACKVTVKAGLRTKLQTTVVLLNQYMASRRNVNNKLQTDFGVTLADYMTHLGEYMPDWYKNSFGIVNAKLDSAKMSYDEMMKYIEDNLWYNFNYGGVIEVGVLNGYVNFSYNILNILSDPMSIFGSLLYSQTNEGKQAQAQAMAEYFQSATFEDYLELTGEVAFNLALLVGTCGISSEMTAADIELESDAELAGLVSRLGTEEAALEAVYPINPLEAASGIVKADRVATALSKSDIYHLAPGWVPESQLATGSTFNIIGGDGVRCTLLQVYGEVNGQSGVFEYILRPEGTVSHQLFKPGGIINGMIN